MTVRKSLLPASAALALATLCAGCGGSRDDGPIRVSVFGESKEIAAPLTNIGTRAGQVSMAATAQGLVTYDANGDVIPGLAQRWIVVDDGKGYIFRLRRARWTNGDKVDAKEVKRLLEARLRAERRADPYGSLASISEILAMTGDVLEIRLVSPRPNFLVALAQPDMGIALTDGGSGPYRKSRRGDGGELLLTPVKAGGNDQEDGTAEEHELRHLRAERPARAIARFQQRRADLVLGGTLAELPYVSLAEVDGRSVRFDPVQGLFGLVLSTRTPMFDDSHVREALSMAIEREAVVSYFDISRWKIADRIVPQQFSLPNPPSAPSWSTMSIEERRNLAIGIIARWQAQNGNKPITLTIQMPDGPGADLLFLALKVQLRLIGVGLERGEKNVDLTLIDEVAPYDSASWYLSRLSCARGIRCNEEAEELLKSAVAAETMAERLDLLGQAEPLVQAHNGFIPLAMPVRWSLVSSRLNAFSPSPRARHDLRRLMK